MRGVVVYSPEGKLLGKIHPPVNPRNLAFGDKDFRTLYMIGNSLYRVRLQSGTVLQVSAQNLRRTAKLTVEWDDEVYLSWEVASTILLRA